MKKLLLSLALFLFFSFCLGPISITANIHDTELLSQWNLAVFSSKPSDEAAYEAYELPSKGIQSDDGVIISYANSIVAGKKSDYEKAKAIYSWVVDNIWYDYDSSKNSSARGDESALDALRIKRGTCVGYANLTIALFRAAGIPAIFAKGHAMGTDGDLDKLFDISSPFTSSNHCWCEAYVSGRWVIIDTAWGSKNTYENGVYSKRKASGNSYSSFDISLEDISKSYRYAPSGYPVSDIVIPDGVTGIGAFAFSGCTTLKSITIADSVKSIGMGAFSGCTAFEGISIPDSVTCIGNAAFLNCESLISIYIPAEVVSIGSGVFEGSPCVTITGVAGSCAETYAAANSIPFKADAPAGAPQNGRLYSHGDLPHQFWGNRYSGYSAGTACLICCCSSDLPSLCV